MRMGGLAVGTAVGIGVVAVLVATFIKARKSRVRDDGIDGQEEEEGLVEPNDHQGLNLVEKLCLQNSIEELLSLRNLNGESNCMLRRSEPPHLDNHSHTFQSDQHQRLLIQRYSTQKSVKSAKNIIEYEDPSDLIMMDFFKVLCLIWILTFGAAQFTMAGSAYNPWTLMDYF